MALRPVVAIFFDVDGTLAPDTTDFLLAEAGFTQEAIDQFWDGVTTSVHKGWDPTIAYLTKLIRVAERTESPVLTSHGMTEVGKKVKLFDGLPEFFNELRAVVAQRPTPDGISVGIEYYITSGGILPLIEATALAPQMNGIFACDFEFDSRTDLPVAPKLAVNFTEKTKFIFAINKGVSAEVLRRNPYRVNDWVPLDEREVPLAHMIYIGDGPSDIPCFSVIGNNHGEAIGVDKETKKGYELSRGHRQTMGPYTPDYRYVPKSELVKRLEPGVFRIMSEIVYKMQRSSTRAPSH